MAPQKEQITPIADYHRAEEMIERSIYEMDDDTHIEYGSTMERKSQPRGLKKWLHQLLNQSPKQ